MMQLRMRGRKSAELLLLLGAGLVLAVPSQTRSKVLTSDTTPIWQLDVGALGYRAFQQRYEA